MLLRNPFRRRGARLARHLVAQLAKERRPPTGRPRLDRHRKRSTS